MCLLSVDGLSKRFGPHVGVEQISFELGANEVAVVLGPNGAGKTTLIRILATLARPSAGRVLLDGESLFDGSAGIRSKLGVLSHETMLYDALSARENLRLHARMHGVDEQVCDRLLDTVGLASRGSERVSNFSHGMRKRVSLARALLHDPDLLLLDEPYSGLDQASLDRMRSVLESVDDRAILAVTHRIDRGVALADRLLFLNDGRLVEDADASTFDSVDAVVEQYEQRCRGELQMGPRNG